MVAQNYICTDLYVKKNERILMGVRLKSKRLHIDVIDKLLFVLDEHRCGGLPCLHARSPLILYAQHD